MVSGNSQRIARNTIFLYIRTLFSQLIALYTSRKILEILGVEDYGIYNVVGGVVSMLTFFNGSMAVATQRFLTVELGRGDLEAYNRVFSMAYVIHIVLALLIVIGAESVGLWFLNTYLNIPYDRIVAANWVYQFSIFSVAVGIMQTPYMASITAHEHMDVYAYVGVGTSILNLIVVFLLLVIDYDCLVVYALLCFCIQLIVVYVYRFYVIRKFDECHFRYYWNVKLFRSMLGFTGWNIFGTVAWILKDQGINMLMNIFGGAAVNAARGISYQILSAVQNLVSGFNTAVNPQLTKNYASGNKENLLRLMMTSSKISFFLLALIAIPVLIEIDYILNLWLVKVPEHTVIFARIILIEALCGVYSGPMVTSLMATGNIKWYQIVVGSSMLFNVPFSYILLQLGYPIVAPLIVSIGIVIFSSALRLLFCKYQLGLSVWSYVKKVIFPSIVVFILSSISPMAVSLFMSVGFIKLVTVTIISFISVSLFTYALGLNQNERQLVRVSINKFLNKISR